MFLIDLIGCFNVFINCFLDFFSFSCHLDLKTNGKRMKISDFVHFCHVSVLILLNKKH
jgi:hypothetical protein